MKWTANYFDGFTERLLCYQVEVHGTKAYLEASWFLPEPSTNSFCKKFVIDADVFDRLLPELEGMQEVYSWGGEDLDQMSLIVEDGSKTILRSIDGSGVVVEQHPEVLPLVKFFEWLEKQVISQLPWGEPRS